MFPAWYGPEHYVRTHTSDSMTLRHADGMAGWGSPRGGGGSNQMRVHGPPMRAHGMCPAHHVRRSDRAHRQLSVEGWPPHTSWPVIFMSALSDVRMAPPHSSTSLVPQLQAETIGPREKVRPSTRGHFPASQISRKNRRLGLGRQFASQRNCRPLSARYAPDVSSIW